MAKLPLCLAAAALFSQLAAHAEVSRDYPIQPVSFTNVTLTDSFWTPRIAINRTVTIPFAFGKCEETGRVYNFEAAAAALQGHPYKDVKMPGFPFDDTDIYKIIEGAAYCLSVHQDPKLEAYVDTLVEKIAAAQEPDGYLFTARTMSPDKPHEWAGATRWDNERVLSHELYNLGHLYEAAVAYEQATGKRKLLDISLKTADLLDKTFGPGKASIWPGHQIVEMGLVKLYRETGEVRYLNLAKFMLDQRGTDGVKGNSYNQSQAPVVDQMEAVGHAVRAVYMYSGMADVAALTGDTGYVNAIDAIWTDVATRKLYLTGGIGSVPAIEGFGEPYVLPNDTNYCETCAAIGNVYWNERMFLLHGDASYVDVMERSLYNGIASGVSLDGMSFFYGNPMESKGDVERQHWFGCACCPGNITRFMASVGGYQYAVKADCIYVNLYGAGAADVPVAGNRVTLRQETLYPWDGDVRLTVSVEKPMTFALRLRVPGWAREEPVPGGLYRFADEPATKPILEFDGSEADVATGADGYIAIKREWKSGDTLRLRLPMPVRRVVADTRVEACRGMVALQRGPIVYCVEKADNPSMNGPDVVLPVGVRLSQSYAPYLLGGVSLVMGGSGESSLTAVPYCVWNNRGKGPMTVWLRNGAE
jgi:DUF1680 family protein